MMPQRLRSGLPPPCDMKRLWELRRNMNCPLAISASQTCKFQESASAVEFRSFASLQNQTRKQSRSELAPCDKYRFGSVTSHEVGWHTPATSVLSEPRRPRHGMVQSGQTNYRQNM